ncbi:hypothetical protein WBG78_29980 [Chryseolinea sp. T2]|uniref:hypothetical protein n=1 Tax=Chryseolinea sp. T2 TaxID=3129255 RepID=UPI00307835CB
MSHVTFHSTIKQTTREEKITTAKVEKFSEEVTAILRKEAAAKMKKLMYVFIRVDQKKPGLFTYEIDDSRDKISEGAGKMIRTAFDETFAKPAVG